MYLHLPFLWSVKTVQTFGADHLILKICTQMNTILIKAYTF